MFIVIPSYFYAFAVVDTPFLQRLMLELPDVKRKRDRPRMATPVPWNVTSGDTHPQIVSPTEARPSAALPPWP